MERSEVREFHYISPIANIQSIMQHGILSYRDASIIEHTSIADEEVQERRDDKRLPNDFTIHRCANLYFNARNAMMYKLKHVSNTLCVMRISPEVLDLPRVLVSDMNASRDAARFGTPDEMFPLLNRSHVYCRSWNDPDENLKYLLKGKMCAEVLVPNRIEPCYIIGVYASCTDCCNNIRNLTNVPSVSLNPDLFFCL